MILFSNEVGGGGWRFLLRVTALLFLCGSVVQAQEEIYVLSETADSVDVFDRDADGNVSPLRSISGPMTTLSTPAAMALDPVNDELIVVQADEILVFPRGGSGNIAPVRTISGAATLLDDPQGIAVDVVNDEIVIVNGAISGGDATRAIRVFSRTAMDNAAPLRSIEGIATGLAGLEGVAVDAENDEIFVTSEDEPDSISVFARTASGNVAPLRTISGGETMLENPQSITVDLRNDELVVVSEDAVLFFARTDDGDVAPLRKIDGAATGLDEPDALAVDPINQEVFVGYAVGSDDVDGTVAVYRRTADGNVAPKREINGPLTQLEEPVSIAVVSGNSGVPVLSWAWLVLLAGCLALAASRRVQRRGVA